MKDKFQIYIKQLQDKICLKFEKLDKKAKFKEDLWVREEGGGGRTRVMENGNIFEKAGVNISSVYGKLPKIFKKKISVKKGDFSASALSLVIHPFNPFVPTFHANLRFFQIYNNKRDIATQWFGGGQDLTPFYFFCDDAVFFHKKCKEICDTHNFNYYKKFKKACDIYFWNSHRQESRGIGGIFFDYLKNNNEFLIQDRYNFVTDLGNNFIDSYFPIVKKRKDIKFNKKNKNWQEIRRGRYAEFNLVHDIGTLFGIKTNGRIESILMSLPPIVQWRYNFLPQEKSDEYKLIKILKKPRSWV